MCYCQNVMCTPLTACFRQDANTKMQSGLLRQRLPDKPRETLAYCHTMGGPAVSMRRLDKASNAL